MVSLKHYSNIFAIVLLAIASGQIFFRFAYIYTDNPTAYLIVYLLILSAGVLVVNFAANKLKLSGSLKQGIISGYIIFIIAAVVLFILYTGDGEPHLYLLNYYFVIGILFTALFFIASEWLDGEKIDFMTITIAVILGALLLMANAFIIPTIIFVLYLFRNSLKMLFLFGTLAAVSFILLDYFLVEESSSFLSLSGAPLTTIPLIWKIAIILISIYVGWAVSSLTEVFISGAFFLMLMSIISIVLLLQNSDFYQAVLIGEPFIVVIIPMALFSLSDYKVDRFLGRVMPVGK